MAVTNTGGTGHEVFSPVRAGHPLDQHRHLLVFFVEPPHPPVFQSGIVHGAGVYPPDGLLKFLQPLFRCTLIDAEYGFVFSGKGVAEPVLQKAGRADDIGTLPEIFQHRQKLLPDFCGESALQKVLPQFFRGPEVAFRCPLADAQTPVSIGDNVGVVNVRADIE